MLLEGWKVAPRDYRNETAGISLVFSMENLRGGKQISNPVLRQTSKLPRTMGKVYFTRTRNMIHVRSIWATGFGQRNDSIGKWLRLGSNPMVFFWPWCMKINWAGIWNSYQFNRPCLVLYLGLQVNQANINLNFLDRVWQEWNSQHILAMRIWFLYASPGFRCKRGR